MGGYHIAVWRRAGCASLLLLTLGADGQSVLAPRSADAARIAELWWVMLAAGALVLAGVTGGLAYLAVRGRAGATHDPPNPARQWRLVAAGGIALPLALALALLVASLLAGRTIATGARADLSVELVGRQWWWEVHYLDEAGQRVATTANEIHIPVDRDVRFLLESEDVIHSFWVPNLQGKTDMIPGSTNVTYLRAAQPGVYRGQCAEFCGIQHALMAFLVIAQPEAEFAEWLVHQSRPASSPRSDAAAHGREVFFRAGCAACHTVRGTRAEGALGPDLTHLAGRRTLGAGILPNRRGHLAGWTADAQALKPGIAMPASPLAPRDFHALLDYLGDLQ